MTAALKTVGGIDHGTPPNAILQQQAKIDELLRNDGGEASETGSHSRSTSGEPFSEASVSVLPRPTSDHWETSIPRNRSTERVMLQFVPPTAGIPAFKLEFDVFEVCIRESYISLLIASSLGFEPAGTMNFRLTYKTKTFPVI